jgi:lambda family phage portal protein
MVSSTSSRASASRRSPAAWFKDLFLRGSAPNLAEVISLEEHRAQRQPQTRAVSSFSGAYGGAYWHDGSKFRGALPNSGMSPVIDHQYTRINAREQFHTTPIARAMVERFAETVVDDGLRLEPTPAFSVLGLTQEQAGIWARSVAARFHLWAKSKWPSRNEQMTLYQIQRFSEIGQQRDGEYFVRFHYDDLDRRRPNPLSLSFVEPDQIMGCAYSSTQGYPLVDGDGIRRDDAGREISYQVAVRRGTTWTTETIPAMLPSGRRLMIHGWCPEYASQTRGYSRLTHAIQEFEELNGFTTAQIQKAIKQSAITMMVETDAGSVPVGSIFGDAASNFSTEDGDLVAPDANEFGYEPMNVHLSPGGVGIFEGLGAGQKIKPFESTSPSDTFASFTDSFIAHLSAASSMPIDVLLLRFNASYSASRAALVMFWRVAKLWRAELESDFLNPVWETWLSEEIAAGRIAARGWLDPIMRLAWLSAEWSGSEMPNIDPEKSIEASRMAIEANLSSFEREARELNGSDAALNKAANTVFVEGMKPAPWKTSTSTSNSDRPPDPGDEQ